MRNFYDKYIRGRLLWSEDDATVSLSDHETLHMAYKMLTGLELNISDYELGASRIDVGDAEWIRTDSGLVVLSSYPGNNEIWSGQTQFKRMDKNGS